MYIAPPDLVREFEAENSGNTPDLGSDELFEAARSEQSGDARLCVQLFSDRFVYDHAAGVWFEFVGNYWREDSVNAVTAALDRIVEIYSTESERLSWASMAAAKVGKQDEVRQCEAKRKVFLRKIACLQKVQWRQSVLQLAAAGKNSLGVVGDEWDADPWALPCINGVIDLRDGSFRPGRPEDFFKTVCPTKWRGLDEPAPAWEAFQKSITDDEALPGFKRRLFGSALPGVVVERLLPIFDGPGGQNGKGTELETIKAVLGALAGPIPAELLLKQSRTKDPDSASAALMSLRGRRLVWASETERGRQFSTEKVKWLTGSDTITGRNPYDRRQVEFKPSHSIFLLTNDLPRVSASDHAFWARTLLIKFPFTFKDDPAGAYERQRDPHLQEKLKAEAPGILAWLVRGCIEWQREGINPPKSVRAHTAEYRQSEDQVASFVEDRCTTGTGLEAKAGDLFKAYRSWAEELGEKAMGARTFGEEMGKKFDSYRKKTGWHYIGLALGTDFEGVNR